VWNARRGDVGGLSTGELIAILLPLVVIELGLIVWALMDLARRQTVKGGSRLLWLLLILCFTTIGPIAYLAWGRNE
jgi:hypothetical protein